jgi:predicted dehydrogenase
MTTRGKLRAAIVGAGQMSRWHAQAVRRAGGVVTAVVDPDVTRAARLAAQHGARGVSTLAEAASDGGIDVAHICTPVDTHDALTREAIALRLHAFVEKPLVPTAAQTESILRDAATHGVLICPVHQFPFQRGVREILAALPRIGPVLHIQTVACSAAAETRDAAWRDRIAEEILPHPLSLFTALLRAPMAAVRWEVVRTAPGELLATGAVGRATLSILVSMKGRPIANSLRVLAAGGTAHADLFHGFSVIESGAVSRTRKIVNPFVLAAGTLTRAFSNLTRRAVTRESAYPGLRELVSAFYAAARGEAPPPVTPEQILDMALARDALVARVGLVQR